MKMFTFKTRIILRLIGAIIGTVAVLTTVSGCGTAPLTTVVTVPAAATDMVPAATSGTLTDLGAPADSTTGTLPAVTAPTAAPHKSKSVAVRHTGTMTSQAIAPPVESAPVDVAPTMPANTFVTTPIAAGNEGTMDNVPIDATGAVK
jgi:hypothetical protein